MVAQEGLAERDASRMMALDRGRQTIAHRVFRDLPSYFNKGDLLLLNNTKVLPARLWGRKKSGGKVEILLIRPWRGQAWECWVRSLKGLQDGSEILFSRNGADFAARLRFEPEENLKTIEFPPDVPVLDFMREQGAAPLPPYIKRPEPRVGDRERYQTVFAEKEGAIAAPTASLHFTPRILKELSEKGVEIRYLTLHVGIGTFQPVTSENVEDHRMQEEFYEISEETAEAVRWAKREGRPVTAVGTTCVRAVESYFQDPSVVPPSPGTLLSTRLFIHPGYSFQIVDRFLTNFHQPESTPLFLTSAFAGKEFLFRAYAEAIREKYRLFSYGDCMWIF